MISHRLIADWKTTVKKHVMRSALKKGVESGVLVQVKASYKLSAEAKKKTVSKVKAEAPKKKAPAKKASAPAKVS